MRFSGFSGLSRLARGGAVAIAVVAIVDPLLSLPRVERPPIRVIATGDADPAPVSAALKQAGFAVNAAESEVATVIVGDRPPERLAPGTPIWAIDTTPRPPNIRIGRAMAAAVRLPDQAVAVVAEVVAEGMAGQTSEMTLDDAGIVVATAHHKWTRDREQWRAALHYLPPGGASARLRVTATPVTGETNTADNVVDVALPAARAPVRLLVVEAGVTWPATFVRRALEGEAAFAVSALQRVSTSVVTRAGSPPAALTRATLAPFEVVLAGGPDHLRTSDLDALRWFVESRGGVVVFVPDQRPSGRYVDLIAVPAFASRVVDAPLTLTEPGKSEGSLAATELIVPKSLPPAATVLAADPSGAPVVFAARRGAGAVILSGALDAWRHRADDRFARFWRRAIAEHAAAVPPALDVTADPVLLRPGAATTITARLRGADLPNGDRIVLEPVSARAIDPRAKLDVPIRLWPSAEPGVYTGEWRPETAGVFNVSVVSGSLRGDGLVTVDASAASGSGADPDGLALVTRASGGRVFEAGQSQALVEAMQTAYAARTVSRAVHPMRSPWWVVAFAGLLCVEWAIRRKRGLS